MGIGLEQTLIRERAKLVRQEEAVEATKALIAMIEQQIANDAVPAQKKR